MQPISLTMASGAVAAFLLAGATPSANAVEGAEGSSSALTFHQLDQDLNGYLTKDEAKPRPELFDGWQSADSNQDDKLDAGEFAAFEGEPASGERSAPQSELAVPKAPLMLTPGDIHYLMENGGLPAYRL